MAQKTGLEKWEQCSFGPCVCVFVRVFMIHTYHYSFSIIVKPLTSECCSFYGNYDGLKCVWLSNAHRGDMSACRDEHKTAETERMKATMLQEAGC